MRSPGAGHEGPYGINHGLEFHLISCVESMRSFKLGNDVVALCRVRKGKVVVRG